MPVRNVLPGVVRKIGTSVGAGEGFWLGRYTVLLSATYGDAGQILTAKRIIWVVPWRPYGLWLLGGIGAAYMGNSGARTLQARLVRV